MPFAHILWPGFGLFNSNYSNHYQNTSYICKDILVNMLNYQSSERLPGMKVSRRQILHEEQFEVKFVILILKLEYGRYAENQECYFEC